LEAPAGTIEPDEQPEVTAQRELQEEVGYLATNLRPLGGFYTAPGFCNEFIYAYVATGLSRSTLPQDADEDVHVEETALADLPSLISSGAIVDAKTIAASLMMLSSATELL
jgi:ADP-ribose pyrophosphatase